MPDWPKITRQREVARTRIFRVEELSLEFSNGQTRIYERMVPGLVDSKAAGAVMIVAFTDKQEFVLIREYSAGTNDYQLAFPKGLREQGETVFEAANREMKEEAGLGGNKLVQLKGLNLAPGYFTHHMDLVLAQDLYPQKLQGDEPEPLQVVYWPLDKIDQLLEQADFTEARSIAALLMAERYLKQNGA